MPSIPILNRFPSATFLRRFGAIVYDLLLVMALEMLLLAILGLVGLFLVGDGLATEDARLPAWITLPLMLMVPILFYVGFWRKGGRTLGMQAWRIQVRDQDGQLINLKQGTLRCLTALFGLSNITCLFSKDNVSLHDRISSTYVIYDKERELI